jgi:hypothetical protein
VVDLFASIWSCCQLGENFFRANKKWALAHSSLPSFSGAITDRAVTTEQIRLQLEYYTDGGRDSTGCKTKWCRGGK